MSHHLPLLVPWFLFTGTDKLCIPFQFKPRKPLLLLLQVQKTVLSYFVFIFPQVKKKKKKMPHFIIPVVSRSVLGHVCIIIVVTKDSA